MTFPQKIFGGNSSYYSNGNYLRYRIPSLKNNYDVVNGISCHLPLSEILAVFATDYPKTAELAFLVSALLFFASGSLIGALSVTAVLMLRIWVFHPYARYDVYAFYSPFILAVAGFIVYRARGSSIWRTLLLSFAIGISLLFRSPLVFFPPVLAVYDWFRSQSAMREKLRNTLLIVIVPYLFLIPWVRLNWIMHHQWIPFEYGEADSNIVSGALGYVSDVDVYWLRLIKPGGNIPDPSQSSVVIQWAIKTVLRHPKRYVIAYCKRLIFAFSLHPWLWALAIITFGVCWGDLAVEEVFLLSIYFVLIHCFMSVQGTYFSSFDMVLYLFPVTLLSRWAHEVLTYFELDFSRISSCISRVVFISLGILIISLSVYTFLQVDAYAAMEENPPPVLMALKGALAKHPSNAWLREKLGMEELKAGHLHRALEDVSRAEAMRSNIPQYCLDRQRILVSMGRFREALRECSKDNPREERMRRVLILSLLNESKKSLEMMNSFTPHILNEPELENRARKNNLISYEYRDELADALRILSSVQKIVSLRRILKQCSHGSSVNPCKNLGLRNELALAYEHAGDHKNAIGILKKLVLTAPGKERLELGHELALEYQQVGNYQKSEDVLENLIRVKPKSARYHDDLGVCLFLSGHIHQSKKEFKTAINLNPKFLPAYLSLGAVDAKEGKSKEALELYQYVVDHGDKKDPAVKAAFRAQKDFKL